MHQLYRLMGSFIKFGLRLVKSWGPAVVPLSTLALTATSDLSGSAGTTELSVSIIASSKGVVGAARHATSLLGLSIVLVVVLLLEKLGHGASSGVFKQLHEFFQNVSAVVYRVVLSRNVESNGLSLVANATCSPYAVYVVVDVHG